MVEVDHVRDYDGTMIVRRLDETEGTERDVRGDGWASRRLLLRDDGMGTPSTTWWSTPARS
jgi:hypothetical protein